MGDVPEPWAREHWSKAMIGFAKRIATEHLQAGAGCTGRIATRRNAAGLAGTFFAASLAATVVALLPDTKADARDVERPAAKSFRLLQFTGAPMKWGGSRLGESAIVTWRVATGRERFSGNRNCRGVQRIEAALEPSSIERSAFDRELRAAMRMWEDAAGIRFRHARDGETADLVIGAQSRPRGRAYTNVSAGRMVPVGERRRIDRLQGAVICLNPRKAWKVGFDGDLKVYDLRHTLAHELGHVIGLDHTGPRGAVMAFRYDEQHRGLSAGDIRGAQRLYGLPTFLRAQNDRVVRPMSPVVTTQVMRTARALRSK